MFFVATAIISAIILFFLAVWCYFEDRRTIKERRIIAKLRWNRVYRKMDYLEFQNDLLRQEITAVRKGTKN